MKRSKTFRRIQALILAFFVIALISFSKELSANMRSQDSPGIQASTADYIAVGKAKNTNNSNSLYYRYWQILKSRAKKHKV